MGPPLRQSLNTTRSAAQALTLAAGGEGAGTDRPSPDRHLFPQQMEYLGRHIARKLNINYFDCLATSYRHVVRHWPLGATFSPGIVQRKTGTYDKRTSQSDLDV